MLYEINLALRKSVTVIMSVKKSLGSFCITFFTNQIKKIYEWIVKLSVSHIFICIPLNGTKEEIEINIL